MPKKEKLPYRIDETVAEIVALLARGFMKYKKNRRLAADSANIEDDVNQRKESIGEHRGNSLKHRGHPNN